MAAPVARNVVCMSRTIIYNQHLRFLHRSMNLFRRGSIHANVKSVSLDDNEATSRRNTVSKKLNKTSAKFFQVPQQTMHQNTSTSAEIIEEEEEYSELDEFEGTPNHEHRFSFEKANTGDKRLGRAMTLMKSRRLREEKVLLEGKRLITDAINAGAVADTIFFCRHEALADVPVDSLDAKFIKVPLKDIKLWTDVVTPQGILAVFKKPDVGSHCVANKETCIPMTLICDNIRDPGNLGAILRSAAAANCQDVLVTKGCVDIWEPKVLRAGCGAHFRISITPNIHWKEIPNYLDSLTVVHVADGNYTQRERGEMELSRTAKGDSILEQTIASILPIISVDPYYMMDWTKPCALVVGSESHGLSLEAIELCDQREGSKVFIPMANEMNSLNSAHAASIIMYEASRQLRMSKRDAR